MLDIKINVPRVAAPLPLQNTLCDSRDGRVVSLLDHLQSLCKPTVVVPHLWRPVDARGIRKISSPVKIRHIVIMEEILSIPSFHRDTHLLVLPIPVT